MNSDLAAIADAMDKGTGKGRDHAGAVKLADAYVAAHPDEFAQLQGLSLEQCVDAVTVFRNANMDDDRWRVEAWLLHRFEPQNIGGEYQAQVRLT